MHKDNLRKLIRQLEAALIYEEKSLLDSQYACYGKLPGELNKKELKEARTILDTLLIQSLNHANILGELITKYYK